MRVLIFCGLVLSAAAAAAEAQPPVRDRSAPTSGTASISGVVVTDDDKRQPVRRARVLLAAAESAARQMAITDDAGQFAFMELPAGRFMLSATKDAYAQMAFGAKRSGGPGTSIGLAEGQRVSGVTIGLPRGAVITGTVTDQNGAPASGVLVSALRSTFMPAGERQLSPVRGVTTDDRGHYRLFGLPAGEYYLSAAPRTGPPNSELRTLTSADFTGGRQQTSDGGRAINYTQVFYPSTTMQAQAALVAVGKGEERSAIDIQLQLTPAARIEGTVSMPEGVNLQSVSVNLIAALEEQTQPMAGMISVRPNTDGQFTFASVAPGRYVVMARAALPAAAISATGAKTPSMLFARSELVIDGVDVPNVALDLQPGLTVSGRVHFEAGELATPDPSRFRVTIMAPPGAGVVGIIVPSANVAADGSFTLSGIIPGHYRITGGAPVGANTPRWVLKSSIVSGQDSLESPVDIRSNIEGVVLTFTDRATEMTGVLQDAGGNAASDYYIIVFPKDRNLWKPASRRVQAVRPAHDGHYTIRNLPPGDYLLAALTDVETNEWHDPAFLGRIASAAMPFSLAEGERKKQDLRLNAQQ